MPRPRRDGQPSAPIRKVKFTAHLIRNLKPEAKAYLVWDVDARGLAVVVQPSGGAAFKFVYGFARRLRWFHIGDARAHALADVRKKAHALRVQVDNGIDPQGIRLAERGRGTFLEIADRYRDEYAKKRNKSWAQADKLVRRFLLKRWGSLPASSITRAEVRAVLAKIEAPILANQVLASASAIFSWAVKQDVLTVNPCSGIERHETKSRERVLSDSEIGLFWEAFERAGSIGTALKLILLLGQRPGEIAYMRREHIIDGWWQMPGEARPEIGWPGTKNGESHRVWLTRQVTALLGAGSGFVLQGMRGQRLHTNLLAAEMKVICAELGVERATAHDLRRSFATRAAEIGIGEDTIDRILGHKKHGIIKTYNRYGYANEDRAAMETVGARILELATGAVAKVVNISRR
jgi:integrase